MTFSQTIWIHYQNSISLCKVSYIFSCNNRVNQPYAELHWPRRIIDKIKSDLECWQNIHNVLVRIQKISFSYAQQAVERHYNFTYFMIYMSKSNFLATWMAEVQEMAELGNPVNFERQLKQIREIL